MSSGIYFAEIRPDPVLRRVVLASGITLAIAGLPLLMMLPLEFTGQSLACLAWCGWSARELVRVMRSRRWCRGIRLAADGTLTILDSGGHWRRGRLLPGSVLLRRFGWFRIGAEGGGPGVELVRGDCREGQNWRRLQVIWQHIGAAS